MAITYARIRQSRLYGLWPTLAAGLIAAMDVEIRRMTTDDIDQVIEIEREAFAPLFMGASLKRDVNNKYARYPRCVPAGSHGHRAGTLSRRGAPTPRWRR